MSKTHKRKAKRAANALAAQGGVTKAAPDAKAAAAAAAKAAVRTAADAVTAAFRGRRWEEALAAVEALRSAGHTPTTVMINKLITACGRAGQWQKALELLQQMRGKGDAAAGPASGVRPTAVSYSAALLFAGQAGEVDTALRVLRDMAADGCAPDAVAYNAAISACRADAAARWRDAAALLAAARREGKADVVTHNALLGVLDKAGQWQLASALLDEMCSAAEASAAGGPASGGVAAPNAVSFASAIAACAAAKQPEAALRLLAAMPGARVAPSAHAYNAALTACERAGRWEDALTLLAKMEKEGPQPDEVTLRSAVFACCSASPPRMEEALALFRRVEAGAFPGVRRNAVTQSLLVRAADMAGEGKQALALLSGFLRADGTASAGGEAAEAAAPRALAGGDVAAAEGRVVRHGIFAAPRCVAGPAAAPAPTPAPAPEAFEGQFHVIHHEPGWQRRPKNKHDLNIFHASPGMVAFDDDAAIGAHVARTDVPGVPGAFVLSGVLSGGECAQLVAASEAMGYSRDEPTLRGGGAASAGVAQQALAGRPAGEAARDASTGSAQDGIDNCVWLVDDSIMSHVWTRVAPHLPPAVGGCALAGVNARWRLFRYAPGAVYRPHVDGAWPGSGVGADGRYVYDAYRDRWSKLTFLVYLNDSDGGGEKEGDDEGFGGGATVFYTSAPGEAGALDARGVAPRAGCVLVFPHGDAPGSLVHEGAAVLRGLKYVARTDVLYKLPPKQ